MKKLTITSENISPKQWSVLLIELNMIKEQWRPYAKLYGGMAWSGDSKWPKIDINTKEKFTETMLTQHCISHTFLLDIERLR